MEFSRLRGSQRRRPNTALTRRSSRGARRADHRGAPAGARGRQAKRAGWARHDFGDTSVRQRRPRGDPPLVGRRPAARRRRHRPPDRPGRRGAGAEGHRLKYAATHTPRQTPGSKPARAAKHAPRPAPSRPSSSAGCAAHAALTPATPHHSGLALVAICGYRQGHWECLPIGLNDLSDPAADKRPGGIAMRPCSVAMALWRVRTKPAPAEWVTPLLQCGRTLILMGKAALRNDGFPAGEICLYACPQRCRGAGLYARAVPLKHLHHGRI